MSSENNTIQDLTVYNLSGQIVYTKSEIDQTNFEFDLNVVAGIYIVEIFDGEQSIRKKVIKQ